MRSPVTLFILPIAAVIAGCATPYQAQGSLNGLGGYKETKIGDNTYELVFYGNGNTSPETVLSYWHRRAKELCGSDKYTERAQVQVQKTYDLYGTYRFPRAEGTLKCPADALYLPKEGP